MTQEQYDALVARLKTLLDSHDEIDDITIEQEAPGKNSEILFTINHAMDYIGVALTVEVI